MTKSEIEDTFLNLRRGAHCVATLNSDKRIKGNFLGYYGNGAVLVQEPETKEILRYESCDVVSLKVYHTM